MIVETGLSERDFMGTIDIENIFQMYDVIFGLSIDRNVSLLDSAAEGFDDVAFFVDEDGGMIPACEFLVAAPVTDRLAKTN